MQDLPDKVLRYDVVKADFKRKKLCQCFNPHYVVDYQNRTVECADCGAIVDPFEACLNIARRHQRDDEHWQAILDERRAIANYKPHLVVIKELERKYRSNKFAMVPCCPHCDKAFDLQQLTHWRDRVFANIPRKEQTE